MERTPGQRAGITRQAILDAAVVAIRDDGLAALTMRRVAADIGVAPNALYSHISDKSALIDGVLDAVLADVEVASGGAWRTRLEALLADTRRVLLLHPDLAPLFLSRQSVGPNALRLGEAMLADLHEGGVRGETAVMALQALLIHTIGAAAFEIPRRLDPDPDGRRRRGLAATQALDPATHPHTIALGAEMSRHRGDAVFQLGLRSLLDGLVPA